LGGVQGMRQAGNEISAVIFSHYSNNAIATGPTFYDYQFCDLSAPLRKKLAFVFVLILVPICLFIFETNDEIKLLTTFAKFVPYFII
jgi:hypothetical protein